MPGPQWRIDAPRSITILTGLLAALAATVCCTLPGARDRGHGTGRPEGPSSEAAVPIRRIAAASPDSKLSPALSSKLASPGRSRFVEVLVDLVEQVDLDELKRGFDRARLGRQKRRSETIVALETVAGRRKIVEAWLERAVSSGEVDVWRGYAIVNRLYVSTRPSFVTEIAGWREVAAIDLVRDDRLTPPQRDPRFPARPARAPSRKLIERQTPDRSWALETIGARRAWGMGWTGHGVIVGSLDTGVARKHTALKANYLGAGGWFDPLGGIPEPYDDHGHGTEILGCAVGRGDSPGEIGVAPEASWVAARANPLDYYNSYAMTAGADWMLRSARADVLVCAWGHAPGRCDTIDLAILRSLRAAEVVVALPAGNSGPAEGSGESPANLPPLFFGDTPPLSVAAVRSNGEVLEESARGPSACPGEIQFPWIAAPGERLRVASASGERAYDSASGTSLAAGYVAGASALLLEKCPRITVDRLQRILAETATDVGSRGPDAFTGFGILNVEAALKRLDRDCHEPR